MVYQIEEEKFYEFVEEKRKEVAELSISEEQRRSIYLEIYETIQIYKQIQTNNHKCQMILNGLKKTYKDIGDLMEDIEFKAEGSKSKLVRVVSFFEQKKDELLN